MSVQPSSLRQTRLGHIQSVHSQQVLTWQFRSPPNTNQQYWKVHCTLAVSRNMTSEWYAEFSNFKKLSTRTDNVWQLVVHSQHIVQQHATSTFIAYTTDGLTIGVGSKTSSEGPPRRDMSRQLLDDLDRSAPDAPCNTAAGRLIAWINFQDAVLGSQADRVLPGISRTQAHRNTIIFLLSGPKTGSAKSYCFQRDGQFAVRFNNDLAQTALLLEAASAWQKRCTKSVSEEPTQHAGSAGVEC